LRRRMVLRRITSWRKSWFSFCKSASVEFVINPHRRGRRRLQSAVSMWPQTAQLSNILIWSVRYVSDILAAG
jgi:hypothetical protein